MKLEWMEIGHSIQDGSPVHVLYEDRELPRNSGVPNFQRRAEVERAGVGVYFVTLLNCNYDVVERQEFPSEAIAKRWAEAVVRLKGSVIGETLPNA